MRPLVVASVLACSLAVVAAPVPKALKPKDDSTLIVGRWKSADGNTQWYEFKDDGTMKTWHEPDESAAAVYRWSIDPTASPKRMTWFRPGSSKPEWECAYELDGDALRMTYNSAEKVPTGVGKEYGIFNAQTRDTSGK